MQKISQDVVIPHYVRTLVATILQTNPLYAHGVNSTLASLDQDEIQHLDDYIIFCLGQGLSISYLAEGYETLTTDVIKESIYFQENKKYRYSSFAEVASTVYYNDEYMSLYMHGVFISLFLWPNHLALARFFRKTLPKNKKGNYLEIGPGHGYFFKTAIENTVYSNFTGIDLSETSIRQTKALNNINSTGKPVRLYCVDFLHFPLKASHFDAIVMGEMLEHVENPDDFLKKIAIIAKKKAYIFITTCINAPIIDHIYLFKDTKQIEDLFSDCGFNIKKQCLLPYSGKTLEECIERLLTINVGYVLEKK